MANFQSNNMSRIIISNSKQYLNNFLDFFLSSGNRKGAVNIMDMRSPSKTGVRQLKTHGKEVCGLKLCPGTPYLAAGEDNGRVSIWDLRMSQLFSLKAHTACAKVSMAVMVIIYCLKFLDYATAYMSLSITVRTIVDT